MQTIYNIIPMDFDSYPMEEIAPLSSILFLDIETTGFSAHSSYLYLIGCSYFEDNRFHTIQWFADNYAEEETLLYHFFHFSDKYQYLIHYNGNHFDIPYLEAKCSQYNLPFNFNHLKGIDLYRRISPYKAMLKLPDLKQKTIENFLSIERDDLFHGGQLISVYHEYVSAPTEFSSQVLLLHNYEDLRGMIKIIPILSYVDLFNLPLKVVKAVKNEYTDFYGKQKHEIIMSIRFSHEVPVPFSYGFADCYFSVHGSLGKLKIELFSGELKHFYQNYKDYYYLSHEDTAIHKSVSAYVDKEYRTPAKASNCYTKKSSLFLPQWETLFTPVFYENYRDKTMYFELTDDFKRDSSKFSRYAEHLLKMMINPAS